ncbi:unnamed protein product [Discula destructiva]
MNASGLMDFEILEHEEARSVFRSPRPSNTFEELEKIAVRERLMKEMGDYDPGYPFRFERHTVKFSLDDLRCRPVQALPSMAGGHDVWKDAIEETEEYSMIESDGFGDLSP